MICPLVRSGLRIAVSNPIVREPARSHFDPASHPRAWQGMSYKETFWMACDSVEQLRAEYGPFHTRAEAEAEAKKLGFGYLCATSTYSTITRRSRKSAAFSSSCRAPLQWNRLPPRASISLHTRCATCGESSTHEEPWQAEVWADIHEFEHSRHRVRLFEHSRGKGLKEISGWRG